jgi:FkbM family methyltransferase
MSLLDHDEDMRVFRPAPPQRLSAGIRRWLTVPQNLSRSLRRYLPGGLTPWRWRGLEVTLEPRSMIARVVRVTGGFEDAEMDIAAALFGALYPDRCIVDVGANVGLHCLAWSRLAPVVALEPAPETFARLQANVAANGLQHRVSTLCTAAGDTVGDVEFFVATDSGFSSLKDTGHAPIREQIEVPCTTLDALAAQLPGPVGLLKIDVEGLERAVIAGAAELLRRDRPVLMVEIFGGYDSNPDPEGTVEDIRAYGYDAFVYASGSPMLNRNALNDSGLIPYEKHLDYRYNYFFIPRPAG